MNIWYAVDPEAMSINVVKIAESRYDMLLKPITHSSHMYVVHQSTKAFWAGSQLLNWDKCTDSEQWACLQGMDTYVSYIGKSVDLKLQTNL